MRKAGILNWKKCRQINTYEIVCLNSHIFFASFFNGFRRFFREFPIFILTVFSADIFINCEGERIKIMPIIEAKMGQISWRLKCAAFYYTLDDLRYWYSNQIMIFTDCNLIKGFLIKSYLKIRIQALFGEYRNVCMNFFHFPMCVSFHFSW